MGFLLILSHQPPLAPCVLSLTRMSRFSSCPVFVLAAIVAGCSKAPPEAAKLEDEFQKMLSGATLVGYSVTDHKPALSKEEHYYLDKISKVGPETWLFQARMKLGDKEVPVPIPVTIKWAGDTPVLTLTGASIPGMGSFTVRLVFYRDQYAGTWSAKDHGGQMFGKIVHK